MVTKKKLEELISVTIHVSYLFFVKSHTTNIEIPDNEKDYTTLLTEALKNELNTKKC